MLFPQQALNNINCIKLLRFVYLAQMGGSLKRRASTELSRILTVVREVSLGMACCRNVHNKKYIGKIRFKLPLFIIDMLLATLT